MTLQNLSSKHSKILLVKKKFALLGVFFREQKVRERLFAIIQTRFLRNPNCFNLA